MESTSEKVKKTMEYLRQEFGINSFAELEQMAEKTPDIDIGLFTSPIVKTSDE